MQLPKPPIQRLHLLAVRWRIIALLPIPRLLMFPLPHRLRRRRSDQYQIRQPGHKHDHDGREDVQTVRRVQDAGDAGRGCARADGCGALFAREGQGQHHGQGGLHGEVDGEEGGLEGGELGSW